MTEIYFNYNNNNNNIAETMEKFYWLNENSRTFLSRGYLKDGISPETRIRQIADKAEEILGIAGFSDKLYDYAGRGFYSFSTPVWNNFGETTGLPVSCFNSYIPDDTSKIFDKISEVAMMSKYGGGTSGFFGDVRPRGSDIQGGRGGKTDGSVRFMEMFDKTADVISQGSARRGSFAAYLPIEHDDFDEFMQIRDHGNAIQKMSIGLTITDKFMHDMVAGNKENIRRWIKLIKKGYETGFPYIVFIDTVNNTRPQVYKDIGALIRCSNLCTEIMLPSTEDESFVCVLSSLNLARWDEMVETDAVETMVMFLDAINEEFVQKSANLKHLEAANKFARRHRALGMGALGWHSYLQQKNVAFESMEAKLLNTSIWKKIRERSDCATSYLATLLGEPEVLKGYGRRNVTTLAIAPTTSSSFILGQVSPSIEPLSDNYFVKDLAKGVFTFKNPELIKVMESYGMNDKKTWKSILKHGGSVQHLDWMSAHDKAVYKTFDEISQREIVIQAAARQPYIDQGQSLNRKIPHDVHFKEVSKLLKFGWESGIKSFYYQRSTNPAQSVAREINNCTSCEG
tara:strand:- start:6795 stop:8501 length:1707 start_codon:yes stop_codon:yes gene_type:complete